MRVAFVTCVELGLSCMQEIYSSGGGLHLVLTLPDEKARMKSGRVYVDKFCLEHQIPLQKVSHINDPGAVEAVRRCEIDWLCIIGWSQIAGEEALAAPRIGAIGMHPTLLPEGRGRASIPWAILKGLSKTGVTLFKLAPGVDMGPIGAQVEIPMDSNETATALYQRVTVAHRILIRENWPSLMNGTLDFRPQDEALATYWPGRTAADGRLLPSMSLVEVDRLVRATTRPYPGAFLEQGGQVLRVWAGRVMESRRRASAGGILLDFRDGCFEATDYSWETPALQE